MTDQELIRFCQEIAELEATLDTCNTLREQDLPDHHYDHVEHMAEFLIERRMIRLATLRSVLRNKAP